MKERCLGKFLKDFFLFGSLWLPCSIPLFDFWLAGENDLEN